MASPTRRARATERAAPARSAPARSAAPARTQAPAGAGLAVAPGTFDIGPALSADDLLHLQRTAGNRAVSAVIQRAPGDDDDDSYTPINTNPVGKDAVTGGGFAPRGDDDDDSYTPINTNPVGKDAVTGGGFAPTSTAGPAPGARSQDRAPDPNVVVPVGAAGKPRLGAPVPAGMFGAVDQAGRRVMKGALAVDDDIARLAYRSKPASVFRSPSDDWHYQMWNEMKLPHQPEEPPPVFGLGRLIAVAPGHPVPATPIPTSISGDDQTGLGTPQAPTETPLDYSAPKPERPMTRAVAPGVGGAPGFGGTPGFIPGPETPGRPTAQAMSTPDVLAAIKADPSKVWRSPSADWHAQMFQLDKGKGSTTPTAYRVGDIIVIAPDHPLKGVPTLAVPGMAPAGGPPGAPGAPGAVPVPTAPTGGGRRTRTDVNVTKGKPGVKGEVMVEDETVVGDTKVKRGRGATGSIGGGNVAAIGGQDVRTETKGDAATTRTNAANLTLKPDGSLVLGGERKVETFKGTDEAGQPIKTGSTAKSGSLALSDKGLTGQAGVVREGPGGHKIGADVSATIDSKGNFSGQAGLKLESKGGTSLTPSVSGGVAVQASDPTPAEGGGFDVTYSVTTTEGVGLGVGKQFGGGPSVGVQLGSTSGTMETGSRHFDDEKKAIEFRDKAASVIAGERFMLYPPPTTVEGALLIPIGEERGSGDLSGSSYGGSVSFEGASFGYGRSSSQTNQFKVKRISKTVVHVTGEVSGTKGGEFSGSGGITLTRGSSNTKGFAVVWEIDLGTKAGKDAFELYAKTGYPPVGGGKLISMTSSGSAEDHDGVSIPLLGQARWTGTTWEIVKTDEKGTHQQFGGQQAHDQDPSWVGKNVFGQDEIHSTAQITANIDKDRQGGQSEDYQAQIEVSGDSGEENRKELGKVFMGVPHAGTARASGKWTLTARVSPAVVHELERVHKEMRAAPTKEAKMRIYAELIKERGAGMVGAQVGLGGDELAWNLELKGDKNFPGAAGRAELERKRTALRQRLGKDPATAGAVAKEVQGILDELRARRLAVKDERNYTDLPTGLRDQQLKLIDKHISDFEFVRHKALREAVKQAGPAKPDATKPGAADEGGFKNDKNAAESADMVRLRTEIGKKEDAISAIDPRIHRAIYAVTQASKHTVNVPSVYGGWVLAHRASYSQHWDIGISLNERQVAMAPKIDALRQKLLEDLFASDRKAAAEALLAQLTDRLSLLEALHIEVIGAAEALKPTTTENGMKGYPRFWGSIKGDEPPWGGGFGSGED